MARADDQRSWSEEMLEKRGNCQWQEEIADGLGRTSMARDDQRSPENMSMTSEVTDGSRV